MSSKRFFLGSVCLLIFSAEVRSQDKRDSNGELYQTFGNIKYWSEYKTLTAEINPYDSLEAANEQFEMLLLQYTQNSPASISDTFTFLKERGLRIHTSTDAKFRIYCWDTHTGGTMHIFRTVYQFLAGQKIYAKLPMKSETPGYDHSGINYTALHDIKTGNGTYYLAFSVDMLSTGLTYHRVKIFSIDASHLNEQAKLIKTGSGIQSTLGYEIDLTADANRRPSIPDFAMKYDAAKRMIIHPLVGENGQITNRKIKYKFTGRYFEKMK